MQALHIADVDLRLSRRWADEGSTWATRGRRQWLTALLIGGAVAAAPATAAADSQSQTFFYTGSSQVFQVPAGVSSIQVQAFGAEGGASAGPGGYWAYGGSGAEVTATVPVSSGELLDVWVGGAGAAVVQDNQSGGSGGGDSGNTARGGGGGAGDGTGSGGGGGGGASELTDLSNNVILAAGGGGGAGGSSVLGQGGSGGAATQAPQGGGGPLGGNGGANPEPNGTAGGDARDSGSAGAGGGGGGYLTGGTGGTGGANQGPGGGGGAGSSYVEPQATSSSFTTGHQVDGNGRVDISWTVGTPVTMTLKASKLQIAQGKSETFTATVKAPVGDPVPTGTVTFVDQANGQNLAVVALSSTSPATAKFSTATLPHGTDSVYAVYSGDSNYQNAYSGAVSVTVYNRQVSVSPKSLSFGNIAVGAATSASVTVTSTGLDPVTVSSVGINAAPFSVTSIACAANPLSPGQACVFTVQFAPTAKGPVTGKLTIMDNATPSTQTVSLSGTGQ